MDALLLARSHELVSSRPARRHPKTIDGPWSWKNDDDGKGVRIGILASNFFFFFVILVDEAGQVLSIPVGVDPKVVDVYRHIFDW